MDCVADNANAIPDSFANAGHQIPLVIVYEMGPEERRKHASSKVEIGLAHSIEEDVARRC